ncbi:hypothetical protein [Nonomuraea sp. NPDC050783]|uniref:hypothetical protein n=1 Tax=Nonomuraea sp. NPDC050783 TaxID=3154634 RepID=UPI0034662732
MCLLLRSAVAGLAVAALLLLLLSWPTSDSDSELRLAMAFVMAPFPLSMVAAWSARLRYWPVVGLVAPFAMLAVFLLQPNYGSWIPHKTLAFGMLIGVPAVVGFMLTALLCAKLARMVARSAGEGAKGAEGTEGAEDTAQGGVRG